MKPPNYFMKTIEREHFEHWLFSQPKDREFDYTRSSECAICAFLKETTSVQNPVVDAKTISTELFTIPTPKWLDDGYGEDGKPRGDVRGVVRVWPLTIANMRRRYLELFPDTVIEGYEGDSGGGHGMPSSAATLAFSFSGVSPEISSRNASTSASDGTQAASRALRSRQARNSVTLNLIKPARIAAIAGLIGL